MAGIKMQWTCFVVMVTAVRSQDSYGSPTALANLASAFSQGASSNNFQPSNFQTVLGSGGGSQSSSISSSSSSNSLSRSNSGRTSVGSNSRGSSSGSNKGGSSKETFIVPGGIDFSQATRTEDGRLCVIKEESIETLSKDPILECTHKNIEQCHYTYITYFKPTQERTCDENFEKICQITFKQEAMRETVKKCYRPIEKVCNSQAQPEYGQAQQGYGQPQQEYGQPEDNQAPQECRTVYESSCTTRYVEKSPGKFVGDTKCEKLPVEICGQGCTTQEGPEECHNKDIDTLVDVPEETCDLNPQKTCRMMTKLVPSLKPKQECTTVPKETCQLKFTQPQITKKPLRTEWCLEDEPEAPQPSYGSPQPSYDAPQPSYDAPQPSYDAPEPSYGSPEPDNTPPYQSYGSPEPRYESPQPSYSSPQPSYDSPLPSYSLPQPKIDSPPPSYSSPQPSYDSPQSTYSSPQPSYGSTQTDFSPSQPIYRSNARSGRIFG